MGGIERWLIDNGFEIESYYQTNKYYCKEITDTDYLYVRIFSDVNKITDVVYKHYSDNKYDITTEISFETIKTLEQLKNLNKALKL